MEQTPMDLGDLTPTYSFEQTMEEDIISINITPMGLGI